MTRRGIHHPLTPVRQAWRPTPEQVEGGIVGIPIEEAVARKPRKTRSKAEQKTNPYESRIQKSVVKDLRRLLPPEYIVQAYCEHQDPAEQLRAKLMGSDPGFPDLMVFGDGRVFLIEMKDAEGVLNKNQKDMHPLIVAAGIPLLPICRNIHMALEFLIANGARTRIAEAA